MLYMVTFTTNIPQILAYITIHGSYGVWEVQRVNRFTEMISEKWHEHICMINHWLVVTGTMECSWLILYG